MHRLTLVALVLISAFSLTSACADTGTESGREQPSTTPHAEGSTLRGPVMTGWILNAAGRPVEVAYQVQDGLAIWEGDIILGAPDMISATAAGALRQKSPTGVKLGLGIDGLSNRWPDGRVYFQLPSGFPDAARISEAMAHIEANNRAIKFVADSQRTNRIVFTVSSDRDCRSYVGRQGSPQPLYLGILCARGNVIHELLHALGMFHEQTRCDRDQFVTINWGNIQPGAAALFYTQCDIGTDYSSYAEESIMHYHPRAFGINNAVTIASKRGKDASMGQRNGMRTADVYTIWKMYKYTHDQGGG